MTIRAHGAREDEREDAILDMRYRMSAADQRYGDFASTHEALGVACEEWDELREAIKSNALASVEAECLDLAAVLMRLAVMLRGHDYKHERSVK